MLSVEIELQWRRYKQQEILVGQQTAVDVKLSEDLKTLDEIVVIGYGETKRKNLTGSISSVSGEDLTKLNPVTFDQAMAVIEGVIDYTTF